MANEEQEGTSAEKGSKGKERSGLAERERQDEEKARVNRERQLKQGVISKEEPKEEAKPEAKPEAKRPVKKK